MDGRARQGALLVVGLLNLVLLGAVACGERGAPPSSAPSEELTARLVRLEAWRLAQERVSREHHARLEGFARYQQMAHAHDVSVDKSLTQQAEAMRLINDVLQDVLAKLK